MDHFLRSLNEMLESLSVCSDLSLSFLVQNPLYSLSTSVDDDLGLCGGQKQAKIPGMVALLPLGLFWCQKKHPRASQVAVSKESACSAGDTGDVGWIPGSGRSSGEGRAGQPTPVFLPGESHGQRSLVGYSP